MAHKVKKPILSKVELQKKKSEHYQKLDHTIKELFGERTKENSLFTDITKLETIIKSIDETMEFIRKYPKTTPIRTQRCGWNLPYPNSNDAMDMLIKDRKDISRNLEVLRMQHKLAVEKQIELENRIKKHQTFEEQIYG